MFIKEIDVFSFGCLENKHFVLSNGFNLIYGQNESGKTTLFAFIKFAFYGTKFKKMPNEPSFKQRYMPLNGKPMAGRVVFEDTDGCTYILNRICGGIKNDVSLFNADTSTEIKDTEILYNIGEYFFGVNADTFSKTSFLSSFSANIHSEKSEELITKLSNIYESGSDEVSYRQISDIIKNEISLLSSNKRRNAIIPELEHEIQMCGIKLHKTENTLKDAQRLSDDIESDIQKLNELIKYSGEFSDASADVHQNILKNTKLTKNIIFIMLSVFLILSGILFIFNDSFIILFLLAAIMSIVSAAGFKLHSYIADKRLLTKKDFTINEFNDKINMINKQIASLKVDIAVKKERQKGFATVLSEHKEMQKKMSSLKKQLLLQKEKLSALNLALNALNCAYDDIKSVFSPELSKISGNILAELTDGKYTSVLVDDVFSVNVKGELGYIEATILSRAAAEQVYLAVRLALVEIIFGDRVMPVFLDDAFAFYDTLRLSAALELMYIMSYKRQIFFSTCRHEEYKILKRKEINIIEFERND